MELEIKIGREESGTNAITVPNTCKKAGRHHAKIVWNDGIVTIEDNESANGTFVNGRRIAKTKLGENDVVWLGGTSGSDCYQVDMKKVFASCRKAEEKARTDYSKEFQQLVKVYQDYQAEESELRKMATKKSQMPKLIASFIPSLIGLILLIVSKDMMVRIFSISIGGVMTGLINMFTVNKGTVANDNVKEQMTELQIKYQPRYCCPKCGTKFPFTTHWRKLEAEGKCPNAKCDARFVKESRNTTDT